MNELQRRLFEVGTKKAKLFASLELLVSKSSRTAVTMATGLVLAILVHQYGLQRK